MDKWMRVWVRTSQFLFFSLRLMVFLNLFQEQRHILAKPDCQEDKFLLLGWTGPLEKFHFNRKMHLFASWLGLLGQYSTTERLPTTKTKRGRGRKSAPSSWMLQDIRGQPSVSSKLAHTDAFPPFFPKCPSKQTSFIPNPIKDGWSFYCIDGISSGLTWVCTTCLFIQATTVVLHYHFLLGRNKGHHWEVPS